MKTYYLILDKILGKKVNGESFLFENGKWVPDINREIQDRLVGYDPYEDDDFYGFGSTSVMNEIREISEEEAFRIMGQ